MSKLSILLSFLLSFCVVNISKAQVYINEFMASNTGVVEDPDFEDSADWIELYNSGQEVAFIGGYYLSDNLNQSIKYEIPRGVEIRPHGYLIIWADGEATGLHTGYKLSSDGEEIGFFDEDGVLIDSIVYGPQSPNISMGRIEDGGNEWGFFTSPTAGSSNESASSYADIVRNKPLFTPLGGIFEAPLEVSIKNTFGGALRYTLDGSEPDANSAIYEGPISVAENTVIRANIFKENSIPGEVITHSYFINDQNNMGSLPVISLSSAPDNFWGPDSGIYVQDYKPEREIPINIELFENDGSDRAAFNQRAGTKVNGLYSWQLPQKMLGIYFRKEYGKGKLEYPIFYDRSRYNFDSFALRASGNDWSSTLMRDGLAQSITEFNMSIDHQGFRQCVVYVNGEYLGIHNIRSKVDQDFILQRHELSGLAIDMIEYEEVVEEGSIDNYKEFEVAYHEDLSVQENYTAVAQMMDVENFTDFIIAELYSGNSSVSHNVMAWKPRYGGQWKWILMDLDRGFGNSGSNKIDFYEGQNVIPFGHLMENENYVQYFGRRMADHMFTSYHPDRVRSVIDQLRNNIDGEIERHAKRWEGAVPLPGNYEKYLPIPSYQYWLDEVSELYDFSQRRPGVLLNDLTDYGFESATPISISLYPTGAGRLLFNGLKMSAESNVGTYPANQEINMKAMANSGYVFKGWSEEKMIYLMNSGEVWKYNDSGEAQADDWHSPGFDDAVWSEGAAELGYGDNDEATVLKYGSDSNDKRRAYYFRKDFEISNPASYHLFSIELKYDDGAIVYVNGKEAIRLNMPEGDVDHETQALDFVGGSEEDQFTTFSVDGEYFTEGANTLAVEIHQASGSSSDISFDLKLSAVESSFSEFVSTDPDYVFTHEGGTNLIAVFESESGCIVPQRISSDLVLNKDCSPYYVPANVHVTDSGSVTVEAGVELLFEDDVRILVSGALNVFGTEAEPVYMRSSPSAKNKMWANIFIMNADSCSLNHLLVEDASNGEHPIREVAALSIFNSSVSMDHLRIENVHQNPIHARYADVRLTNSYLHSSVTGDLINIKYGKAYIENCEFVGNLMPDTDAIDYDDITDGVIKDVVIRDFHGFNSDAIDIGEQCQNVTIENAFVYNITDKGVSVGQQSSVNILNSVFVNCNLGAGLKDSSKVKIDACTYYGNTISIACYEKNPGDAGGNAWVTNSILSNAYEDTYLKDDKSTLSFRFSASDNDPLPPGQNNLFANPQFVHPDHFDFTLAANSACLDAGKDGNMGASLETWPEISMPYVSAIAYNSDIYNGGVEFLLVSNSGNEEIDLSGFAFTRGISYVFPEGSTLYPDKDIYISNNAGASFWLDKGLAVYEWDSGRLADEGESIQLEGSTGIIFDRVRYYNQSPWPNVENDGGIMLKSAELDNHFAGSWYAVKNDEMLGKSTVSLSEDVKAYPNPFSSVLQIVGMTETTKVEVLGMDGRKVMEKTLNASHNQLDLSGLKKGIYLLKIGDRTLRVVKK